MSDHDISKRASIGEFADGDVESLSALLEPTACSARVGSECGAPKTCSAYVGCRHRARRASS